MLFQTKSANLLHRPESTQRQRASKWRLLDRIHTFLIKLDVASVRSGLEAPSSRRPASRAATSPTAIAPTTRFAPTVTGSRFRRPPLRVRIDAVPPEAIVHDADNPVGEAVVRWVPHRRALSRAWSPDHLFSSLQEIGAGSAPSSRNAPRHPCFKLH
jgi:hypothetical protein